MGILSSIGKVVKKGLDANLAFFSAPITTVTKGVGAGLAKTAQMGAVERTAKIVGTAATLATATLGVGTAAGRAAIAAVTPATTKGKITAAVATPILVGGLVSQPKESAQAIIKAPTELAKFGGDIASFAADPSVSTAKDLITESPILTAASGLLIGGAVVKATAPIVGGLITKSAIEDAAEKPVKVEVAQPQYIAPVSAPAASSANAPSAPVTPQLVSVAKTPSKKRRKARTKAKSPSVSQRVNVIVSNRAQGGRGITVNNKYLKEAILV